MLCLCRILPALLVLCSAFAGNKALPTAAHGKVNNLVMAVVMMQDGKECQQAASKPEPSNSTTEAKVHQLH